MNFLKRNELYYQTLDTFYLLALSKYYHEIRSMI